MARSAGAGAETTSVVTRRHGQCPGMGGDLPETSARPKNGQPLPEIERRLWSVRSGFQLKSV